MKTSGILSQIRGGLALLGLIVLASLSLPSRGSADTVSPLTFLDIPTSYQGQLDVTYEGTSYLGRFVHMAGRGRFDYQVNDQPQAIILRHDLDQAIMLWPAQKWYVSTGLSQAAAMAGGLDQAQLDRRPDGTERVNGEPCTRWAVKSTAFEGHIWLTVDGILMKGEGRVTTRGRTVPASYVMSHLERKSLDPAQFSAPQDWLGLPLNGLLQNGQLPHF